MGVFSVNPWLIHLQLCNMLVCDLICAAYFPWTDSPLTKVSDAHNLAEEFMWMF
jgi:hypothetical protein